MKQERARSAAMPDPVHFEVGDAVKVKYLGVDMYGTLKWQGDLQDGANMAGIEMVSVLSISLSCITSGCKSYRSMNLLSLIDCTRCLGFVAGQMQQCDKSELTNCPVHFLPQMMACP